MTPTLTPRQQAWHRAGKPRVRDPWLPKPEEEYRVLSHMAADLQARLKAAFYERRGKR